MNFPVCGKEMTEGLLQAYRQVYFVDGENPGPPFRPGKNAALLTRENLISPTGTAWCCRNCKKVVVDYSDIPQSHWKSLL